MTPLSPEFGKVLADNLWNLYARDDTMTEGKIAPILKETPEPVAYRLVIHNGFNYGLQGRYDYHLYESGVVVDHGSEWRDIPTVDLIHPKEIT